MYPPTEFHQTVAGGFENHYLDFLIKVIITDVQHPING